MAANNTPLPDLVELDGLAQNNTYSVGGAPGSAILGVVDNATYSDSSNNNNGGNIVELYATAASRSGTITIGGIQYNIALYSPESLFDDGDVTVNDSGGGSTTIPGDGDDSDVVFIVATPTGGGTQRFFALFDDDLGDIGPITSLATGEYSTSSANNHDIDVDQDNNVQTAPVCFVAGTMIDTLRGPRPIESIRAGDRVLTLDHGAQPVLWSMRNKVPVEKLIQRPNFRPIIIPSDALAPGIPKTELRISPQHRIMLRSKIAQRLFSAPEILVGAKKLVGNGGIRHCSEMQTVEYYHILCARHEIVFANSTPTETMLLGPLALAGMPTQVRNAALVCASQSRDPARKIIRRNEDLEMLYHRHSKNGRNLLCAHSQVGA
ncbi:MAG: Hint domain-containing protein [Sulfitobacter sp.]